MLELVFSERAKSDLFEIGEYLEVRASLAVSNEVKRNIFATFDLLLDKPEIGRAQAEKPFRRMSCLKNAKNGLVFWRTDEDKLRILRVIRGERQSQRDLLGDG